MFIPFNYNQGGSWSLDSKSGPFPAEKVPRGKILQTHGRRLGIADANKSSISLTFPANTWIELQDNREWGWNIFWSCFMRPDDGATTWYVDFALDTANFLQARILDRFGQVPKDFPGKIASEKELESDAASDGTYYESLAFESKFADVYAELAKAMNVRPAATPFDAYHGLAGFGQALGLRKTGFFHVEKKTIGGRERWLLVDPEGNPFFHLGICCFAPGDDYTDISGRAAAFEWIPPHEGAFAAAWKTDESYWSTRAVSHYRANLVRKYGSFDITATALRNIARVRQAGFNSMGAFGEVPDAARQAYFPYVKILPLSGVRKIPTVRGVFDPYDPETVRAVEGAMESVRTDVNSALLIGYFLENEQAMEAIPRAIPALDDSWAAKRAFQASGKSPEDFAVEFLEKYYSLIVKTFRACDPHHLLIGNRWMPSTADREALCRVAGRYLDAISINYYTREVDPAFARRIYEWSGGKPQIWSEFFYSAGKEANTRPFTFDLPTQRERGMTYRRYVKTAASLGFVVGTEWFTLVDQSATGRFFQGKGGESYNTGLLSVTDRPYRDLWKEMRDAHLEVVGLFLP